MTEPTTTVELTGNINIDALRLTNALDECSHAAGLSLADYAVYLDLMADALTVRAGEVETESEE